MPKFNSHVELLKGAHIKALRAASYDTGTPEYPATNYLGETFLDTQETAWMMNTTGSAGAANWDYLLRAGMDVTVDGAFTFDRGAATAPFLIAQADASTVTNLDADKLDGYHGSPNASADTVAQRYTAGRLKVGEPSDSSDAVTKAYADALFAGVGSIKEACQYVVDSNVTNVTTSAPATIDGASPSVDDRILVAKQTTASQNGIWLYKGTGNPMTRAEDADQDGELKPGSMVYVTGGTSNADTSWAITDVDTGVISPGTTAHTWALIDRVGEISGGDGIAKSGSVLSTDPDNVSLENSGGKIQVKSDWVGQASLTTLGTVTTGTWNATTIGRDYGGTGQTTYAQGDLLVGNASSGLDKLAKGTEGYILKTGASTAEWYDKLKFLSTGVEPVTTDTVDIGSDSKRIKSIYVERDVDINGDLIVDGDITAPTIQSQRIGRQGGFSFDGVNDYLAGPSGVESASMTISIDFTAHTIDAAYDRLIETNYSSGFAVVFRTTNILSLYVDGVGFDATTPLVQGKRHNIIFTFSASGATAYVDGKVSGTTGVDMSPNVTTNALQIGRPKVGNGSNYSHCDIYDVRLYSSTKTAAQALAISQGFNDTDNLELHLSETSTEDALWVDVSGKNRSASNNGATRIESPINKSFVSETEYVSYRKMDGGYRLGASGNQNIATPNILLDSDFSILLAVELKTSSSATRWLASSDNGGTSSRQFEIYQTTAGALTIQIGGSSYISANGSPGIDGPAVIAVTFDESTALLTCYINGQVFPLTETVNTFTAMGTTALPIKFGDPTRTSGEMDGDIYEARIFNHALDAESIAEYSRGAATKWVDRIGIYELESKIGSIGAVGMSHTDTSISGTNSSGSVGFFNLITTYPEHPDPQATDYNDGFVIRRPGAQYLLEFDYTGAVTGGVTLSDGVGGTMNLAGGPTGSFSGVIATLGDRLYIRVPNADSFNGNNIVLTPLGEVAHYTPSSATSTIWEDVSTLENHATNDGAGLLKSELHETFVTEQDFLSAGVKHNQAYHFNNTGQKIATGDVITLTPDFTFVFDGVLPVDTGADSGNQRSLFVWNNSGYSSSSDGFYVEASMRYGELFLVVGKTSVWSVNDFFAVKTGTRTRLVISLGSGNGWQVWQDGKKISSNSNTVDGTPDYETGGTNVLTVGHYGANTKDFGSEISGVKLYNRALTDSEVSKVSRGQHLRAEDYGASGNASYSSSFTAGTDGFAGVADRSVVTGNEDAVNGEDNVLKVTQSNTNTGNVSRHGVKNSVFTLGKNTRVTGRYYIPSGQADIDGIVISTGNVDSSQAIVQGEVTGSWVTFEKEFIPTSTSLVIWPSTNARGLDIDHVASNATDYVAVKDIVVTQVGLCLDLNQSSMTPTVWRDQSGNSYTGTVTGATLINERRSFYTKDLHVGRDIYDALNDTGTTNQVLTKTANGAEWADAGVGGGFVTGSGTGKQMVAWAGTGASSALEDTEIYADNANDYFGFGSTVTSPDERIQTDGNISLLTNGAHLELPEDGSFTFNAYYDAVTETDFVTRATGYAAQLLQESDGDIVLKVTTGSLAADTALNAQWTDRITVQAATNQVDFSGDITAVDGTFSGDVTISTGQLNLYEKITSDRDNLSIFVDEDDNAASPEDRYFDIKFGTTQRFKFGFDGTSAGNTRMDQIASVGTGAANNLYRYLDDSMTGTWAAGYDKVQMYAQGSGYVGPIDNQHDTWAAGITHVKGTSYFWKPMRATSTDSGSTYSNWVDGPSFGYDVLKDSWVINGDLVLAGIVFNSDIPPARVYSEIVTTHASLSVMDFHLINHGLGTEKVAVQVFEWASSKRGQQVFCDVWASDDSTNVTDAGERDNDTGNNLTIGVLGGASTQSHLVMVFA